MGDWVGGRPFPPRGRALYPPPIRRESTRCLHVEYTDSWTLHVELQDSRAIISRAIHCPFCFAAIGSLIGYTKGYGPEGGFLPCVDVVNETGTTKVWEFKNYPFRRRRRRCLPLPCLCWYYRYFPDRSTGRRFSVRRVPIPNVRDESTHTHNTIQLNTLTH